jgi:O-methyltransferase involved in polyketide biosynthesis
MPEQTRYEPPAYNPTVPNVARMYDYYLGGKNNFAADREAADKALAVAPELRAGAAEVRKFLTRAVRYLADRGIRQFVDIGCGLPTQGNVHEIAQAIAPDARVAYVDNDPEVVVHARALLETNPFTRAVQADLRDPDALLALPEIRELIDFNRPVAVLLIAVLHLITDDDEAMRIVGTLRAALPVGGYLVLAHAVGDLAPQVTTKLAAVYQENIAVPRQARPNLRGKAEVERYLEGMELVEPGLVSLSEWRPDPAAPWPGATPIWAVGGVARKV